MNTQQLSFLFTHGLCNFFVGGYVIWVFEDICARVLSPLLVKLFRVLETSLVVYLLLRVISVSLLHTHVAWYHACWYGWYPCFFASAFASLSITWLLDKSKTTFTLPFMLKLVAVVNIIASALVLTNDYHYLCFSFEPGYKYPIIHNEPLIFPIKLLIIVEYLLAIVRLLQLSLSSGFWSRKLMLPAMVIVPAVGYTYLYTHGYLFVKDSEHVAINAFFVTFFWQLAVKAKLFPCYGYYNDLSNISSPKLEAEAIYNIRKRLTSKIDGILQAEAPCLLQSLTALETSSAEADRNASLHSLKLSLSFMKKHCLLFLQQEIHGYIEAEDFSNALKESIRFANEAGCSILLLPINLPPQLPGSALQIHKVWNDILQQTNARQTQGLMLQVKLQKQLQLSCTAPLEHSKWLEALAQELSQKYNVSYLHHLTEDGAFLTLTTEEGRHG